MTGNFWIDLSLALAVVAVFLGLSFIYPPGMGPGDE